MSTVKKVTKRGKKTSLSKRTAMMRIHELQRLNEQLEDDKKTLCTTLENKCNQIKRLLRSLKQQIHLSKPVPLTGGPEMPKDATEKTIPRALYLYLCGCWKRYGDYRSLGVCAAVAFFHLLRKKEGKDPALLEPDQFLLLIFEHYHLFEFEAERIVLNDYFDRCLPRLGDVLGLNMNLLDHFSPWESTLMMIKRHVEERENKDDVWFLVHLQGTVEKPLSIHMFICVATFTHVTPNSELHAWKYTCYDQKNHDQENPQSTLTFKDHFQRFCTCWIITFDQGPVLTSGFEWRLKGSRGNLIVAERFVRRRGGLIVGKVDGELEGEQSDNGNNTEPWDQD